MEPIINRTEAGQIKHCISRTDLQIRILRNSYTEFFLSALDLLSCCQFVAFNSPWTPYYTPSMFDISWLAGYAKTSLTHHEATIALKTKSGAKQSLAEFVKAVTPPWYGFPSRDFCCHINYNHSLHHYVASAFLHIYLYPSGVHCPVFPHPFKSCCDLVLVSLANRFAISKLLIHVSHIYQTPTFNTSVLTLGCGTWQPPEPPPLQRPPPNHVDGRKRSWPTHPLQAAHIRINI